MSIPERDQQICMAHASLIHQVVLACKYTDKNSEARVTLESGLEVALQQGWLDLVRVIRAIVNGNREASLLNGLDEEDTVIVTSILGGVQKAASLPDLDQQGDRTQATPGLAKMVDAASRGD